MSWQFERVAGPFEGELGGVVWDGAHVLFTAVEEHRLLRYDPSSNATEEVRRYTNRASGLAQGGGGELYAAQPSGRRVIEFMSDGSVTALKALLDGRYNNNPNDLVVDRSGRIWFCDPHLPVSAFGPARFPFLDHASVLRLERDSRRKWTLRRITFDTVSPRALALSADERTLFVADGDVGSAGYRELRAYGLRASGEATQCRLLHSFGGDARGVHRGVEGMCLDAEGNIVACAGWRESGPGPLIYVFAPSGRIIETHEFPADMPMRCAFGGNDLGMLYVTTAGGELYRASTSRRGISRPDK